MSVIAIITARGGSKRIPGKNIRNFLGKPIIAYSIEAALQSGIFDEVMVSTDSEEIASIAAKYGASVPFFRSEENAGDYAATADVIREVILQYQERGKQYDWLCCLYPTAPFVTADVLREAYQQTQEPGTDAVVPVVKFSRCSEASLSRKAGSLPTSGRSTEQPGHRIWSPSITMQGSFIMSGSRLSFRRTRWFRKTQDPIFWMRRWCRTSTARRTGSSRK